MKRQEIIDRLTKSIEQKAPIIGVCIGNGRSAKQATKGGADIIATLNAGRFRMSGLPSIASTLPFSSCNDLVLNYAKTEVVPQIDNVPVIFGACAQDPLYGKEQIIKTIKNIGFDGIVNFPTVSLIDGQFREALEEQGEGYNHEVELLRMAHESGLFTVAFAVTMEEAIRVVEAGVDVL